MKKMSLLGAMVIASMLAGCGGTLQPTPTPSALANACDLTKNYKVVAAPYQLVKPGSETQTVRYQEIFELPGDNGSRATFVMGSMSQGGSRDEVEPTTDPDCITEHMYLELTVQPRLGVVFSPERLWLITAGGVTYKPSFVSASRLPDSTPLTTPLTLNTAQPIYFHFFVNGWQEYARVVFSNPAGGYLLEREVVHGPDKPCALSTPLAPTNCPT